MCLPRQLAFSALLVIGAGAERPEAEGGRKIPGPLLDQVDAHASLIDAKPRSVDEATLRQILDDAHRWALDGIPSDGRVVCGRAEGATSLNPTGYLAEKKKQFRADLDHALSMESAFRVREGKSGLRVQLLMDSYDEFISGLVEQRLTWVKACTLLDMAQDTEALAAGVGYFDALPGKLRSIIRVSDREERPDDKLQAVHKIVGSWVVGAMKQVRTRLHDLLHLEEDDALELSTGFASATKSKVIKHIAGWAKTNQDKLYSLKSRRRGTASLKLYTNLLVKRGEKTFLALQMLRQVLSSKDLLAHAL